MAPKRTLPSDLAAPTSPKLRPPPSKRPRPSADAPPAAPTHDVAGYGRWKDWPAPHEQMETAREWIRDCVKGKHRVLLIPDKDADGLSSACLLAHTFHSLSHDPASLKVYHLPRSATNIHSEQARSEILATTFPTHLGTTTTTTEEDDAGTPEPEREPLLATRCIVLDQGSRPGPALVPGIKTLLIDHHLSETFPDETTVLSACHSLPVATTSLLVYELCCTLVPTLRGSGPAGLAALIGAYGDLGAGKLKFGGGAAAAAGGTSAANRDQDDDDVPWPASLAPIEKQLTKSGLAKSVALINAPRRTPEFRVSDAYRALVAATNRAQDAVVVVKPEGHHQQAGAGLSSKVLKGILDDPHLIEAKERTSAETQRWQGAPPVFTKDGKIAVVTIDSGYQIHPVIATRWTGTLRKAKTLVCVMCANTGYTPGYVHFSCRAPRKDSSSSSTSDPVDLIAFLRSLAPQCEALAPGWTSRVGEDWARGHREATGGIIRKEEFDVLMTACQVGIKKEKKEEDGDGSPSAHKKGNGGKKVIDPGQKTTLDGFFKVVESPVKAKAKKAKAAATLQGGGDLDVKEAASRHPETPAAEVVVE